MQPGCRRQRVGVEVRAAPPGDQDLGARQGLGGLGGAEVPYDQAGFDLGGPAEAVQQGRGKSRGRCTGSMANTALGGWALGMTLQYGVGNVF